jgi:hypothetical protein
MKYLMAIAIFACATIASAAPPKPAKVLQGAVPKWVLPPPATPIGEVPKEGLVQFRFLDNQIRVSRQGQESFITQRFKILRPEALQAANLRFVWRPSSGQLMVHSIRRHRQDGSSVEMLGKAEFQILQREENLEQSILTGLTTAIFPVPGVEVGDELEFSTTITDRDPTLFDRPFGAIQLPMIEIGGIFRARLLQSDDIALKRQTTPDLETPASLAVKTADELVIKIDNPKSVNLPEGAPGRFAIGRLVEYSSFANWGEISMTFSKFFEQASKFSANSPVRAEVAKIAALSSDPEVRILAALRLVQDRIRYVYVGLGTGSYMPASAEQTWERRYGDCKAKTALLLAVLRELGISAEAVLVNASGLDGIQHRLASPALFDHVLVRATVGSKSLWLDGTLLGSPRLEYIAPPKFSAALPLRTKGAELENIAPLPLSFLSKLEVMDIDATAGKAKPARVNFRSIIHGDEVLQLRAGLASLAGNDLKQALRSILGRASEETEDIGWSYDESTGALTLKWIGTEKLDWKSDGSYYLPAAGFTPPNELKRPKGQDQSAPWSVDFPFFSCWITTIRLPPDQGRVRWDYFSRPVDRVLGGVRYFRQATLRDATVQTIMSKRALKPELSTAEAAEIASALTNFDKAKSYVYQRTVGRDADNTDDKRAIIAPASIDWASGRTICQPPPAK